MVIYPENAVILAPLSDYSDYPFRRACRRHGCQFAFTPLVDAGCLAHHRPAGQLLLHRAADEPWLGVQLLGSNPSFFEEAVRAVNDHAFDVLDLNLGCPMPKVVKRGAGAALGRDLAQALMCVEVLVKLSRFPVTAKIRVLSATDPEPTLRLALALEAAGVQALTIHGRVLEAIYAGPVATDVIRTVREALRIPVIANGGVFGAESAEALRRDTGCSRIMVARGAIGNPWVFRDIASGGTGAAPTPAEVCQELEDEVRGMVEMYGEGPGLRSARKIMHGFLRGRGYRHTLKERASHVATLAEFAAFMTDLRAEPPAR